MSKDESIIKSTADDDDDIQKKSLPPSIPQTPVPIPVCSKMTFPSPFLDSSSRNPSPSISSIPTIHPPPNSPMLARPPGLSIKPQSMSRLPRPIPLVPRALSPMIMPQSMSRLPRPIPLVPRALSPMIMPQSMSRLSRPIPLVPRALSAPFPMLAQGMRLPYTPLPKPLLPPVGLPGVTPVGPLGGSFVNSTASGNQSAVSSVTDAILLPQAGNDKPVSDVSINAVEQLDAWTAYKTERGPVFYYNAVTGISTSEKPVVNEGELSMPVQECYLCLISRLPKSATTEQVRQIFSQFGRILDATVLKNNFDDVSMGRAYIIFETRTARSAAMGCHGMFLGGNMISVCDAEKGFGVNAYEFEDSLFNDCITIGETHKRGLIEWPDCGRSHVEKATQMLVAGDHERSFKRLCCHRP
ncbi:hypothetical protein POM88_001781 [Heracleum sosnowskyi]|uniref:RRM domain-containing protein n=1 Tax=Heracleum sosnowskyi TaxID=360622 RepID=A0AAD8JGJ1_9APIA|nr:hypothetical protein POM88_001781 [Heracleum sosnowskyi]